MDIDATTSTPPVLTVNVCSKQYNYHSATVHVAAGSAVQMSARSKLNGRSNRSGRNEVILSAGRRSADHRVSRAGMPTDAVVLSCEAQAFKPRSALGSRSHNCPRRVGLRDIMAHCVIDYQPVVAGPAVDVADHMQKWFEAGAADGFWISPDVNEDGIDAFVDGVVPLLQQRALFHHDYEGKTLRDHIGALDQ